MICGMALLVNDRADVANGLMGGWRPHAERIVYFKDGLVDGEERVTDRPASNSGPVAAADPAD